MINLGFCNVAGDTHYQFGWETVARQHGLNPDELTVITWHSRVPNDAVTVAVFKVRPGDPTNYVIRR